MVVTEGDPANPTTLLTKQERGVPFISSYAQEDVVMHTTLEWLPPSPEATAICTDRQTLLMTIQIGSVDASDLRRLLDKRAFSGSQATTGLLVLRRRMPVTKQVIAIIDGNSRPVTFAAASAFIR